MDLSRDTDPYCDACSFHGTDLLLYCCCNVHTVIGELKSITVFSVCSASSCLFLELKFYLTVRL